MKIIIFILFRFVIAISSLFLQVNYRPKAVLSDVVIILCTLNLLELDRKGNVH